jgi:hypothetical protein
MKIFFVYLVLIWSLTSFAQPINYQGRLSDKSGTNVNGTKTFSLRIFDAKTGGKQIYEENIGAVTVNEGAYSFNFGENGKSVVTPTETIAFVDGEKQIFNYIVKNTPVLGEIKISGGGYSWTESGSSDATKFTATANKNSGAVSAIFLAGAPQAGDSISISYDHNSDGVMGALSLVGQAWLEITVGGETLSPRERLVTVPFALYSKKADSLSKPLKRVIYSTIYDTHVTHGNNYFTKKTEIKKYEMKSLGYGSFDFPIYIPDDAKKLIIKIVMDKVKISFSGPNGNPDTSHFKFNPIFKLNGKTTLKLSEEDTYILESPKTGSVFFTLNHSGFFDNVLHVIRGNIQFVVLVE